MSILHIAITDTDEDTQRRAVEALQAGIEIYRAWIEPSPIELAEARERDIPERTIRRWWAEGRLTDPERHGRAPLWDVTQLAELAEWRHERNPQ